ncbi:hypothetical protein CCHR01_17167 [Colletotrichum chrysophilum]|uniref:Uncharacterized protein n=1 Tax=Colletotrichum chrysophilum TaxID=1836956 RepID=A0AAD9E9S6_9PEZI|nr:hypothetical protein CCHR01_17167 [Colletotrichum chrysophilum]
MARHLRLAACMSHSTLMSRPGPTSLAMCGTTASLPMATSSSFTVSLRFQRSISERTISPDSQRAASAQISPRRPGNICLYWRKPLRCAVQNLNLSFPADPTANTGPQIQLDASSLPSITGAHGPWTWVSGLSLGQPGAFEGIEGSPLLSRMLLVL